MSGAQFPEENSAPAAFFLTIQAAREVALRSRPHLVWLSPGGLGPTGVPRPEPHELREGSVHLESSPGMSSRRGVGVGVLTEL